MIQATQSDHNLLTVNQTIGRESPLPLAADDLTTHESKLTVDLLSFPISVADKADGLYRQAGTGGILGFGTTAVFEDSIVGHHIVNRSLQSMTVGFDLRRQEGTGWAGEISWGGVDRSKADTQSFVWLERAETSVYGEWTTELDGLVINGQNISLPSENRTAVFEPGALCLS